MKYSICQLLLLMLLLNSCTSKAEKEKQQHIQENIVKMQVEMDSMQKTETILQGSHSQSDIETDDAHPTDQIVGVWEVKNDHYMAIYEIEQYRDTFIGKVHYYNDGDTEYKGTNRTEDYFLNELKYENGSYIDGKMYMPDGSFYKVIFTMDGKDKLIAKMTIQGEPYTEIWTRQEEN